MLLSRRLLRSSVAVAAIAAVSALSCKDKPAETAPDAAAATTPPVASSVAPAASTPTPATSGSSARGDRDRRGGHGGPGASLFQAARALDLKPEQKAKVEAAEKSAHEGGDAGDSSRDAMKAAAKELHTELIAGIKAGKIDNAKLEPKYAAIEKVAAGMHQKEAEAITALHAALDPTQRKAVTASVRAKTEKREDKREEMKDRKNDHVQNVVDAGGTDAGFNVGGMKRTIDRLTRGLELDAEQQKKVDAISAKEDAAAKGRPDFDEMKKHIEALLVAFEKDTFDAKKLEMFDAKKARGPMEQETKLLVQILPILKPEQREKLAARMDKGPSPHDRRGGFGHRGGGAGGDRDRDRNGDDD